MEPGQQWPFPQALQAALVFSANDASYALAQRVSGSLARFAALMTYAAGEMGLTDHPVLHDPAGLDGTEGFEGGNLISAWDVAIIARDLMAIPSLAAIVAARQLDFRGPNGTVYGLHNQNLFFLATYPGAIGVKTGLTDRAGFCVAEEAVRGGRHMLAVVLNGKNSYQSAAFLLSLGFATPVGKEHESAPVLPPLAVPAPPGPPTPAKVLRMAAESDAEGPATTTTVPTRHDAPKSSAARIGIEAGVAFAGVVMVVGGALWAARGRWPRRKTGAHRRRR
jgi:D-alanyl-D-alanine carboxypeptidase (penicillin-binding protein 5/6)